jgi:retron-type reverse transcriptase
MAAAKIVLEPIFEADFSPVSFGFRPGRSAIDACEAVRQAANRGNNWGLDADVSDCFGSIDHDALVAQVALSASDRRMLRLLRSWLRVGVMESGEVSDTTSGTPQGSPISPLLANIALTVVDKRGEPVGWHLGVLVRYAAIHDARPLRSAPSAMAITCRWDELADRLYEAYGDIADDIQCYSVVDYWHDEPDAGDQWNDVNRRFRDLVTTRS